MTDTPTRHLRAVPDPAITDKQTAALDAVDALLDIYGDTDEGGWPVAVVMSHVLVAVAYEHPEAILDALLDVPSVEDVLASIRDEVTP